jgi:proton glutamate symport protein
MLKLLVAKSRTLGYILVFFLAILLALISANYMAVNAIPVEGVVLAKILFFVAFTLYATARQSLTFWILFALCLGVEFGVDFPGISIELKRFSDVFLRLIKTIVAPLIFGTLVVGIAGHSNLKQVGRMGLKAIIYFEIVTTLALFIGLAAINFSKAGVGAQIKTEKTQVDKGEKILSQKKDHDPIVDSFPENIAKSVAEGQVLQIVVFSILFAIGMSLAEDKHRLKMLSFAESLSEVMFKFTHVVMYLAPFAVFGAMAYSIATMGTGMLTNLFKLLATLYIALIAFVVLVFIPIGFIIKLNFKKFIQAISEPVSIAFATASSEAALPKALQNMERYGVSRKVVSFVLPTGYSFNLDGTTLYLSLASVFVAQVCGMDLSIGQQISICLVLMLTSKGVAGVRGASFLILVTTLDSQGIDSSKAFAILGIDALMDMARTSVNVVGNCLATVAVAKWEGEVVESIE